MGDLYHEGNRRLQDRFDTRRLADRIEERINRETFDEDDRAFVESRDMFFLATADEHGSPQCSYKGGDPGFVRVLDERTLAFPSYDGNGMYLSHGEPAPEPAARTPLHRLLEPEAAARQRRRVDRRARPAARGVRRGAARRAGGRHRRLAQLSPVRAPAGARRAIPLRPARGHARHRFPTGSGATGRTTCCRKGIRPVRKGCFPINIDSYRYEELHWHRYLSMGG